MLVVYSHGLRKGTTVCALYELLYYYYYYVLSIVQSEIKLLQWSLYFKTTHVTKKKWSYIASGLKIKVI